MNRFRLRNLHRSFPGVFTLLFALFAATGSCEPLPNGTPVRGWNILSNSLPDARAVISRAPHYDINHLQLSHELVMDLNEIKNAGKLEKIRALTTEAHAAGIPEVVLWDHALYPLGYYPKKFRTGPKGTLDLDDPAFWDWFKDDYRAMLDLVPEIDGLVLTFIETGARAEDQHSEKLTTHAAKLAAVVDAVAGVVITERKLNLYIRTFSYTHAEYDHVIAAVKLLRTPGIRLMMKETPHDFFLTHPNDMYAGAIPMPTIIEFDCGNEFSGQGIIANTWPEQVLTRAADLLHRPHVTGYVARTDRYGDTRAIGRSSEILLHALDRAAREPAPDPAKVRDKFIATRYGDKALPLLRAPFSKARDIVPCSLYTLGTNTANHSKLDYDPYPSSYARHVSGKWIDPPVVRIGHGVNREFHYWKDVIEHLAPARLKSEKSIRPEAPFVVEQKWLTPGEAMNPEYLGYVIAEKSHGVKLAREALLEIEAAKPVLDPADYADLHATFERTLLTARLHRAVATAYFGFRVWSRGGEFQTPELLATLSKGLDEIKEVAALIESCPHPGPVGQWHWSRDASAARGYFQRISKTGWKEYGVAVPARPDP